MTSSISRGSAQIYELPPRGRFALNVRDQSRPRTNLESPLLVKVSAGSAWYHEAAIEEAGRES